MTGLFGGFFLSHLGVAELDEIISDGSDEFLFELGFSSSNVWLLVATNSLALAALFPALLAVLVFDASGFGQSFYRGATPPVSSATAGTITLVKPDEWLSSPVRPVGPHSSLTSGSQIPQEVLSYQDYQPTRLPPVNH